MTEVAPVALVDVDDAVILVALNDSEERFSCLRSFETEISVLDMCCWPFCQHDPMIARRSMMTGVRCETSARGRR